jgi:hypothetical protein
MSALGHKRTLPSVEPKSALPPKADIEERASDVCFVPQADIPESGGLRQRDDLIDILFDGGVHLAGR